MVKFNSYVKHLGQHQVVEKMMHPNTAQIVVPENARSWIASSYIANGGKTPLIIVTLSLKQAENLAHDIRQLWPNIDLELSHHGKHFLSKELAHKSKIWAEETTYFGD